MTAFAHAPAAIEIRTSDARRHERTRLRLLASGDGWSLLSPDGKLVFHALGVRGRRRCLEFARAHGVLAVIS
jgi:hypothetical protein